MIGQASSDQSSAGGGINDASISYRKYQDIKLDITALNGVGQLPPAPLVEPSLLEDRAMPEVDLSALDVYKFQVDPEYKLSYPSVGFIVTPKTCTDTFPEWWPGVIAYFWPGSIPIHADSVNEAAREILWRLPPGTKINQIMFWGHGGPGKMDLGGNGAVTINNFKTGGGFDPLLPHMIDNPKIIFQGCNTFSGVHGQDFAVAAANYFNGTAGGYNAMIGIWLQYPGYHELSPGQLPHWPERQEQTKICRPEINGEDACGGKMGKTK